MAETRRRSGSRSWKRFMPATAVLSLTRIRRISSRRPTAWIPACWHPAPAVRQDARRPAASGRTRFRRRPVAMKTSRRSTTSRRAAWMTTTTSMTTRKATTARTPTAAPTRPITATAVMKTATTATAAAVMTAATATAVTEMTAATLHRRPILNRRPIRQKKTRRADPRHAGQSGTEK